MGMNTGAKMAHFGTTPGMIRLSRKITMINPTNSGSAPALACSSAWAVFTASARICGVVGDELGNHQKHEDQAAQPDKVFVMALMTSALRAWSRWL